MEIEIEIPKKKEKQRTKKWKKKRAGRWTSSMLRAVMTNAPGKSRLDWDNMDRLLSFGDTALKYIYENAMERKTGRYLETGDGSYAMRYGTIVEPLIRRMFKEQFVSKKKGVKIKHVGFKEFPTMPNAGVSSDSILKKGKKVIATVEMKACTNWQTHFERTFDKTNEKSKDFWQMQGHNLAYETKTCYYVTAEPPEDITKYIFYNGNIMDLYEDFKNECQINIERVKSSTKHQKALLRRIAICEQALNDWLSVGGNLRDTINETIAFFEANPEKMDEYIPPLPFQKNTIEMEVAWPPWSESKKSYCLLTSKGKSGTSWSNSKWFPKKKIKVISSNEKTAIIRLPKWLHKKIME